MSTKAMKSRDSCSTSAPPAGGEPFRAPADNHPRDKERYDFLAHISHELRTPLNAIIGFSDIIENEILGPIQNDQYRGYVHDIKACGEHLLSLISDILDVSKLEVGEVELDLEIISMAEVIGECVQMMGEKAKNKGVLLRIESSDDNAILVGDRLKLKQVVLNLFTNAIKFTPRFGNVEVSLQCTSMKDVLIEVRDDGVGIAQADIQRVVEPFYQVRGNADVANEGIGLGLAICNGFMVLHGGRMTIESELQQGTVVRLLFPVNSSLQHGIMEP